MGEKLKNAWKVGKKAVENQVEMEVTKKLKEEVKACKIELQVEMCQKWDMFGFGIKEKAEEICEGVVEKKLEEKEKKRRLEEKEDENAKKAKRKPKESSLSTTLDHPMARGSSEDLPVLEEEGSSMDACVSVRPFLAYQAEECWGNR